MVKGTTHQIAGLLKALPPAYKAVLVYGPDNGLVKERADILLKQIVEDTSDPFNVARPDESQLAETPSLLADELQSLSMMGGRRAVLFRGATDKASQSAEMALEGAGETENILLITAGDLSARSRLRKLFESAKNAITVPCYTDSAANIGALITEVARQYNLDVDRDVFPWLQSRLGSDHLLSRMEIEKLCLYVGDRKDKTIHLSDAEAATGEASGFNLSDIAIAVTGGNLPRLDTLLEKAAAQGESAIGILRILQNRLMQLHLARGMVDEGRSTHEAMKSMRPPVFFKEQDVFLSDISRWTTMRLAGALDIARDAELQCKSGTISEWSALGRACMRIAMAAKS